MPQELGARNAELERLAYAVGHDLTNPLVTIKGFLGSLKRDATEGAFDRLPADIERIDVAATQMGRLFEFWS